MTMRNGLWRYHIGDVIEIAGFHPDDGPIVRNVERCKYITKPVGYKHCCGMFTTLHKRKAHYSRLRSTLVPSVACQTTEGEYHSTNPFLLTDTL